MAVQLKFGETWKEKVVFCLKVTNHESDENAASTGTGFLMLADEKMYIVTCKHVLEGYRNLIVYYLDDDKEKATFESFSLPLQSDDGSLLWSSPENGLDLAKYPISVDENRQIESVRDFGGENVRQFLSYGDQVFAFGFPGIKDIPISPSTRFPILKSGFIAYPAREDWNGQPVILVDISLRWGYSGGLMFCKDLNNNLFVLGVVFEGLETTSTVGPLAEVGKIIKWDAVRKFVDGGYLVYLKYKSKSQENWPVWLGNVD